MREAKKIENPGMEVDILIEKIKDVVDDFNEVASYFQKNKLSKLGENDENFDNNFQSPGSKDIKYT